MKLRPVAAESFDADGQTDAIKLTVAFRNVAKEPENILTCAPKIRNFTLQEFPDSPTWVTDLYRTN